MPDPDPAEYQPAAGLPQPTAGVTDPIDRLISWAIARGDAAVDEIHAYLVGRGLRGPMPCRGPSACGSPHRRAPG